VAELVLALDVADRDTALALLDRLPEVRWVKIGPVLFTSSGPALLAELKGRGLELFLDLKWHDIPNTVQGAVSRARAAGAALVTVHTLGGVPMMAAAKQAAGGPVKVVGVTVLTSHDAVELSAILGRETEVVEETVRRARMALQAGLDGVVASPLEVGRLREVMGPDALLVTPGIRSTRDAKGDQARTATASEAARAGANLLVVGRPVLAAADPAGAWNELLSELR
jgi:orotidine-5'-phosphate decarboxylase